MSKLLKVILLLFLSFLSHLTYSDELSGSTAEWVIEQLQLSLIQVMQNAEELGFDGRFQKLDSVIRSTHSFPRIAKVAAGRHWKKLTPEQRGQFVEKFSEFSVANYASMFNGFSGEEFKILAESDQRDGRKLVRTLLVKSDGEAINLDYILSLSENGWQIINIKTNGISDLALKRSEFSHLLDKDGFEGLITRLEQKIQEFSGI